MIHIRVNDSQSLRRNALVGVLNKLTDVIVIEEGRVCDLLVVAVKNYDELNKAINLKTTLSVPLILIDESDNFQLGVEACKQRIGSVITWDFELERIEVLIQKTINGENFICQEIKREIVLHSLKPEPLKELSDREMEILRLIGLGNTSKWIAEDLGISLFTVNTHRKNILRKLQLKSSADLIFFYLNNKP